MEVKGRFTIVFITPSTKVLETRKPFPAPPLLKAMWVCSVAFQVTEFMSLWMWWGFIGMIWKGSVTLFSIHGVKALHGYGARDCSALILYQYIRCTSLASQNYLIVIWNYSLTGFKNLLWGSHQHTVDWLSFLFGWSHKWVQKLNWELMKTFRSTRIKCQWIFLTCRSRF